MRIVCVYKGGQDYTRSVDEWLENFYRQTGHRIETIDPDENTSFCEVYDIVEYPTILAIDNSGVILSSWRGRELPLFNEVEYYYLA